MSKGCKKDASQGRRSFLVSAATAALFAIMPEMLRPRDAAASGMGSIDALWRDPANARIVGRRYLEMEPAEMQAMPLMHEMFGERLARGDISADALRRAVAIQRRDDFANGDTVIVDGWLLSRTEARLCALSVAHYS